MVSAHCKSTLAFANNKVEGFALFVGDQAPRSSEQDEALPSRPSTASQDKADRSKRTKPVAQRGFGVFPFVRLAPMKNLEGTSELAPYSLCFKSPSSIFGALGTPAKPNRDVPCNALLYT